VGHIRFIDHGIATTGPNLRKFCTYDEAMHKSPWAMHTLPLWLSSWLVKLKIGQDVMGLMGNEN